MRVFAISDLHVDYQENYDWVTYISNYDYKDDILVLAGDITSKISLIEEVFQTLKGKFKVVLFVPGNHDLWIAGDQAINSLDKFNLINRIASDNGIDTRPYTNEDLTIVPLYSWYDYSFGQPSLELYQTWVDFKACVWPVNFNEVDITRTFLSKNDNYLNMKNKTIITFSHFLPRIDLMSPFIPMHLRKLYPVLGTHLLNEQLKVIKPNIHVYGHSHVNMEITKDDVLYINNAFGYPYENNIARKKLICIYK